MQDRSVYRAVACPKCHGSHDHKDPTFLAHASDYRNPCCIFEALYMGRLDPEAASRRFRVPAAAVLNQRIFEMCFAAALNFGATFL